MTWAAALVLAFAAPFCVAGLAGGYVAVRALAVGDVVRAGIGTVVLLVFGGVGSVLV